MRRGGERRGEGERGWDGEERGCEGEGERGGGGEERRWGWGVEKKAEEEERRENEKKRTRRKYGRWRKN